MKFELCIVEDNCFIWKSVQLPCPLPCPTHWPGFLGLGASLSSRPPIVVIMWLLFSSVTAPPPATLSPCLIAHIIICIFVFPAFLWTDCKLSSDQEEKKQDGISRTRRLAKPPHVSGIVEGSIPWNSKGCGYLRRLHGTRICVQGMLVVGCALERGNVFIRNSHSHSTCCLLFSAAPGCQRPR